METKWTNILYSKQNKWITSEFQFCHWMKALSIMAAYSSLQQQQQQQQLSICQIPTDGANLI